MKLVAAIADKPNYRMRKLTRYHYEDHVKHLVMRCEPAYTNLTHRLTGLDSRVKIYATVHTNLHSRIPGRLAVAPHVNIFLAVSDRALRISGVIQRG